MHLSDYCATDYMALRQIEGGSPSDPWFEAFPPRARTMEEWAETIGDELAFGPLVIVFDDDADDADREAF